MRDVGMVCGVQTQDRMTSASRLMHHRVADRARAGRGVANLLATNVPVVGLLSACIVLVCACGGASSEGDKSSGRPPQSSARLSGVEDGDALQRCSAEGSNKQVVEYDTSGDQFVDVRKVYLRLSTPNGYKLVPQCRELDVNGDGRMDSFRYYSEQGVVVREENDRNLDGRIDLVRYMQGSRIIRVFTDTNFDGVVDQRAHYRDNQPHRIERDTQGKSTSKQWRPDHWEYVENGQTVRVGRDLNGDGRVDRWDRNELAGQR